MRHVVIFAVGSWLAACSGNGSSDAGKADAAHTNDAGGVGCGAMPAWSCVSGTVGGSCSDALEQPVCTSAQVASGVEWTCETPLIRTDQCACLGRPPGNCTCTATGWSCVTDGGMTDGGPPDSGRPDAAQPSDAGNMPDSGRPGDAGGPLDSGSPACSPGGQAPFFCVSGTPGGQCGDGLLQAECGDAGWACPGGTIPTDQCACLGLPLPGCTCGAGGWQCPDGGADAG